MILKNLCLSVFNPWLFFLSYSCHSLISEIRDKILFLNFYHISNPSIKFSSAGYIWSAEAVASACES
jgi:hypothetical protein